MRRRREHQTQGGGTVEVSVVIPAHNEEGNVFPLMDQFAELARRARFSLEVIVVDDGSRDRTLPRLVDAQRTHRFIKIVSLPRRRGLTEALQAGFSAARGSTIVFYPADRQFHPNDIPRMIDRLREGYDLVTGRKIGQYDKRVVSGVYNRLSRWLFPTISVTDLNSVKAFRRELIDVFDYRHDWHRFWVAIAAEAGYRIGEVDVTLYKRPAGRSKFGWWRIPGGVLDLLAVKFQYHTMRRPLWYFGMTGSVLFVLALVVGGWALYQRFVLEHGYRPLLYLVMTLGISSVVFFALGFLAESVAGIRQRVDSLRGGPRFQLYHPPARRYEPSVAEPLPPESTSQPAAALSGTDSGTHPRGPRGDRRHRQDDRRRGDRRPRTGENTGRMGTTSQQHASESPQPPLENTQPKPEASLPVAETITPVHAPPQQERAAPAHGDPSALPPQRTLWQNSGNPAEAARDESREKGGDDSQTMPETSAATSERAVNAFGRRNRR